ncbi:hypothetical protein KNT59_gp297 [Klebsiella phage KPV15]|uniref:Uncharacterized protein n=1 Tax=Klebsiella phage KPV15 TaxID=1913572 RepID=A0A1J0MHB6_9CAUD|nr:hypothetical protein KNT59_gp297 [Klebsiella phage KPV15]APD20526.1 hypothetical protein [Klebsiella phage KPV15]QEG10877.1 hypothetical protein KMI11_106 [Klebsiella phage KMI11]
MMRLVKVVVEESEYMGDSRMIEEFVTVEADSESEIADKVYRHFDNMSDSYGTMYNIYRLDVIVHIN